MELVVKILYLHGFGSAFDPSSEKIIELSKIGLVEGINIDYSLSFPVIKQEVSKKVLEFQPDIVVGTSMGGWLASHIGSSFGIPFVAINPVISPCQSLEKYLGTHKDHTGKTYTLTYDCINTYKEFSLKGCGLILLDSGDEVIPYQHTLEFLEGCYEHVVFEGGSHRFDHMTESLQFIKDHYELSGVVYGA
jgi:predicted esterase YcpF (UPF0227 family)